MRRFDDFDAWGDAVSGASLRLACDGVETPAWSLGLVALGDVVLQVASEGGGNICYGGNAHAGTQLFLPLTRAADHVANGERLDDESLFVIPHGADFRIRLHRRAHAWCSIALPPGIPPAGSALAPNSRVMRGGGAVGRLRNLVCSIADSLLERPPGTAAHAEAGRQLLAAATACLPTTSAEPAAGVGRPRLDRAEIVRRAMASLEAATVMPTTAELAGVVGVTGRTLQRTFQESFGVPPKRYLLLRELHAIRRSLRAEAAGDFTVADVLVRHGVWEFGRFAARYRRHFGELPSETLRATGA